LDSGLPLLVDNGANVTLILYGQTAVGEYAVQTAEWRYYLGDAQLSVRQLVDESGAVTQVQTYGPYGVLLHQAGDGGGLFGYQGGQAAANGLWYFGDGYFDPNTGQFLATNGNPLLPLVAAAMVNPAGLLLGPVLLINWRRRRGKKGTQPATFLLLGVLLAAGLSGCDPTPTPPTEMPPGVPTPPTPTGTPTLEPTVTVTTVSTPTSTETVVTITATPAATSCPPAETPPPPTPDPMGTPFRDPFTGMAVLPSLIVSFTDHPAADGRGIDIVPETSRKGGADARGFHVVSLRSGYVTNNKLENQVGPNMVAIKPVDGSYEIMYSHIVPTSKYANAFGKEVSAGEIIGTIMDITQENYAAVRSNDDHLHLGYREPVGGTHKDPSFLISDWGPEGFAP
jgi:hypothetical protein